MNIDNNEQIATKLTNQPDTFDKKLATILVANIID